MDSSIISIIIVLITMGLFVWNRLPISVVAILGSVAMAMFIPEMDLSAVYSLSLIHISEPTRPY